VRLRRADREVLEHDVWVVDGGRGRFLTSLLNRPDGVDSQMLRFDEGCMRPADKAFGEARNLLLRLTASRTQTVRWVPGRTLVIDNWRCLHARDEDPSTHEDRVLERILVAQ
jgi:alpha-ketoglutarate-dependent taurine dioxygenase